MPNPFPHPTNNVLREYPQFFQVSTLFSKKELLENSEKDALFYEGTQKPVRSTVLLSQGL